MVRQNLPNERSISLATAIGNVQKDLDCLSLNYRILVLGHQRKTIICRLYDQGLNQVSQGVGKGPFEQALVGALFEALEHYITTYKPDHHNWSVESSYFFSGIKKMNEERVIRLLAEAPEAKLAVRSYASRDRSESIKYPVFITDPAYPQQQRYADDSYSYDSLLRYSSNSGTATGSSFLEAYIHATNEVVERDAFSEFLVSNFYAPSQSPLRLLDCHSLPSNISLIIENAAKELDADVSIIDITNRLRIPSYIACIRKFHNGIPIFGCGTSLDPLHAVVRSIDELVQCFHVRTALPGVDTGINLLQEETKKYPRLYRCFAFDIASRMAEVGIEKTSIRPLFNAQYTLDEYCLRVEEEISLSGNEVYAAVRCSMPSGTTAVTALIPGSDRFFNVTLGSVVLPSKQPSS